MHRLGDSGVTVGIVGIGPEEEPVSARALLHRALDWLVAQGMDEARGPCSFNLHHEAGLLVEGLGTDPVVLTPHNPPYYEKIYLALGLRPVQDLYGWWIEGDAVHVADGSGQRQLEVPDDLAHPAPDLRLSGP